jgi:hypothetical protein
MFVGLLILDYESIRFADNQLHRASDYDKYVLTTIIDSHHNRL